MVFLDGSFKGFTPIYIDGLSVGITHHLMVSRAGYEDYSTDVLIKNVRSSCHKIWYLGMEALACEHQKPQTINITLKKVESTLKPTIPTVVPTTAPIPTPTPEPTPEMSDEQSMAWWETPEWKELTAKYSSVFA
jgi:hypothetical protein